MLKRLLPALLMLALAPVAAALPSDEMFEKLKAAGDAAEAADVADDIWLSWMESGSPTADLVMSRAADAINVGETELAHELLDRVILLRPDFAEAWHRRAGLFLSEENYTEALRDLNEALAIEPRHFGAWLGMGFILEQLGGEKEALDSYREALKVYPLMPQALSAEARLSLKAEGVEL
ncbi:tetratricopeptide repeat protein [Hyphomonas sp. WL0036]|uniref:tetratricopeptide repeat protein n=1 Tax=Hyphomonas sediminis TaxID=2866160 RepID=UPI001C7F9CA2|nr:tetratricopeptide repeat protein [Hyphomonas sediminis]MBY9066117.1 tetratricopeptide repeat protein [Hyphomonas sediminis]